MWSRAGEEINVGGNSLTSSGKRGSIVVVWMPKRLGNSSRLDGSQRDQRNVRTLPNAEAMFKVLQKWRIAFAIGRVLLTC